MDYDLVSSFLAGMGTTLAIAPPAEWGVHKYILHGSRKLRERIPFIENASRGHNDIHHRAYRGPAHYYRDKTNEKEVIHFSPTDVGIIAGIAGLIGASISGVKSLIKIGELDLSQRDGLYTVGAVVGAMTYYGAYEIFHRYMHIIGESRQKVSATLGDSIQGGETQRDGKLRLSKPLLDDVSEEILTYADAQKSNPGTFEPKRNLVSRLEKQLEHNRKLSKDKTPILYIEPWQTIDVLKRTACEYLAGETDKHYGSDLERLKDKIERKALSLLRRSRLFKKIDRHHFIHHVRPDSNLNVVVPLGDFAFGTKIDSSIRTLEENVKYWLCPNSPDVKPFERPIMV